MTVQEEDFRLSQNEREVYDRLRRKCAVNNIRQFSADTVRGYGLDKMLYGDEMAKMGVLFRKWLKNGLVVRVGQVASAAESRHHAEIKLYEFSEGSK